MAVSQEQLELPLFLWLDENVDETQWSEESIELLREVLLFDGLKTVSGLRNRCSKQEQNETWVWIMDDAESPFSFNVCARTVGVDPDRLRIAFARMAEREVPGVDMNAVDRILERYLEEPGHRRHDIKAITAQL